MEKAEIPLHVEKFEVSPRLSCIEFKLSLGGHKTHSVEKLNKCNQCDYASTQANTLRAHVKPTVEKSQTDATNVCLHPLIQVL